MKIDVRVSVGNIGEWDWLGKKNMKAFPFAKS
jgi:hypothetical protein